MILTFFSTKFTSVAAYFPMILTTSIAIKLRQKITCAPGSPAALAISPSRGCASALAGLTSASEDLHLEQRSGANVIKLFSAVSYDFS